MEATRGGGALLLIDQIKANISHLEAASGAIEDLDPFSWVSWYPPHHLFKDF